MQVEYFVLQPQVRNLLKLPQRDYSARTTTQISPRIKNKTKYANHNSMIKRTNALQSSVRAPRTDDGRLRCLTLAPDLGVATLYSFRSLTATAYLCPRKYTHSC